MQIPDGIQSPGPAGAGRPIGQYAAVISTLAQMAANLQTSAA